jgi:hypothetical protein
MTDFFLVVRPGFPCALPHYTKRKNGGVANVRIK